VLAVLALAGCADVAPWQRSKLAHPSMAAPEVSPSRAHLQALQEGATGGDATVSAGCGCN
jgi:hypothetical protein